MACSLFAVNSCSCVETIAQGRASACLHVISRPQQSCKPIRLNVSKTIRVNSFAPLIEGVPAHIACVGIVVLGVLCTDCYRSQSGKMRRIEAHPMLFVALAVYQCGRKCTWTYATAESHAAAVSCGINGVLLGPKFLTVPSCCRNKMRGNGISVYSKMPAQWVSRTPKTLLYLNHAKPSLRSQNASLRTHQLLRR